MHDDVRGLPVTAASAEAVQAIDHTLEGYLGFRADLGGRVEAMMKAAPDCGMAHIVKGYLMMLGYHTQLMPAAQAAVATAATLVQKATPREQAHAAALTAWIEGNADRTSSILEEILQQHPRDMLAFRTHHQVNFWFGRADKMLTMARAVESQWPDSVSGYNTMLGCRSFAHEESGLYLEAETVGREAIRRDPTDLWAAHAVAHTLEMTGRRREGIAWIDALQGGWDLANNVKHHLWWHQAMYHLDLGDMSRVLHLYDTRFRNLASPLVQMFPDLYIDVQNAASMLFRLSRHGVDPGDRWIELADKAERRIGDCLSAFTLPHWMMALAAAGREDAARRMLAAMRDYAQGPHTNARIVGDFAIPVCQAILAHGLGQYEQTVALMRPILGEMYRLGGSHAQQDVLEQVFLDAALTAGLDDDCKLMIERVSARNPVPPARRRGYAMAA
ncbi:MAG: tetratricopeptide repeat protein [Acetobacteraceae bacterium]|nr:tetratricopeptide repeat protein [Acetobacteraceae bacterium]